MQKMDCGTLLIGAVVLNKEHYAGGWLALKLCLR